MRLRVEQLLQAKALGTPLDSAMVEWIKALPSSTTKRLVRLDLLEERTTLTLAQLIERFLATRTVREGTVKSYKQCTDSLVLVLGGDTLIDQITTAGADAWRATISSRGRVKEKAGPRTLSTATVAKRCNIAKAIFSKAKVWGLLPESPFRHVKPGSQSNPDREHYVSLRDTEKLLEACTTGEWRALIGLARYAGLRCPSEVSTLRWTDINWEQKSLTVRSSKTAASAQHAVRTVPICVELQPILLELFEEADAGEARMVPLAHASSESVYQGLRRIVKKAGLEQWPRLSQNLRSSCATDWAGQYPIHESSKWLGHSPAIAAKHYLQSRDLHFKGVTGTGEWRKSSAENELSQSGAESGATVAQNAAQQAAATFRTESQSTSLSPQTLRGCASPCDLVQPRATA